MVHVDGEEHDCANFLCIGTTKASFIDKKKTVPSTVLGDSAEYVRAHDPFIFKWGGEQRVEVYLHNRRVRNSDVEIAVTGLLFHGPDSEDNTDLDDVDCETFVLQVGDTKKVKFTLDVDLDWSGNDTDWCDSFRIDTEQSGLMGGDVLPLNVNLYTRLRLLSSCRLSSYLHARRSNHPPRRLSPPSSRRQGRNMTSTEMAR